MSFAWTNAPPGSNFCTEEGQIWQQAEHGLSVMQGSACSAHCGHPRVREHHVHQELHHKLQCLLRSAMGCGVLLPAQRSQGLKMAGTGLKVSERLLQPDFAEHWPQPTKVIFSPKLCCRCWQGFFCSNALINTQKGGSRFGPKPCSAPRGPTSRLTLLKEAHQAIASSRQASSNSSPWQGK